MTIMKLLSTILKITGIYFLINLLRQSLKIPSIYFLLGTNIFMLIGFLYLGWDFKLSILIFWIENIIISWFVYLRLSKYPATKAAKDKPAKGVLIVFLIITFVHGLFVLVYAGTDFLQADRVDLSFIVQEWQALATNILLLIASYYLAHKREFLNKKAYLYVKRDYQFSLPAIRIMLFHVFLIIGIFVFLQYNTPLVVVSMFIFFKILADIAFTYAEIYPKSSPKSSS